MQSRAPSPGSITVNVHVPGATVDVKPIQRHERKARPRSTVRIDAELVTSLLKSERYSVDDSENDWICLSSDGVLYGLREENARINSKKLYDPESPDLEDDNIEWHIKLNTPSAILDVLFEYLYNNPRTNLETIPFDTLVGVTHAAEEYRVQSAIDSCRNALRKHIPRHSMTILGIAGKYGYREELLKAAPYLVDQTLPVIGSTLPPNLHMPWCIYREQFIATHRFACESYPTDHNKCQHWNEILLGLLPKLRGDPGDVLNKVETIFDNTIDKVMQRNGVNACCIAPLNIWCQKITSRRDMHVPLQVEPST